MSRCVLLNIAHHNRRPCCQRAAFRILGVFPSAKEAEEHAANLPRDASLHLLPLCKWTPIMRDEDVNSSGMTHLEALGQRHRDRIREHAEEFEANVANRRAGAVHSKEVEKTSTVYQLPGNVTANVSAIPISSEVRMQRFAVVSVIQDDLEPCIDMQQPAVLIWEVAETEQEAQEIIKERIGRTVTDVHLDVVAMYEWLFPTAVDLSKVKEEYRDSKLDDLMRHRKEEHLRVAEFRKLCEERGQEVPLIDVSKPGAAPLVLPPLEPPTIVADRLSQN